MPNSRKLQMDNEFMKASMNKNTKKDNLLQNALANYEFHQKRKKRKNKNDKVEDVDNFSV